MTYSAGTLVTVKFAGEVKGILTTDDFSQQLSDAMQNVAGYSIKSISITTPTVSNMLSGAWLHYLYTGAMVINVQWDEDDSEISDAVSSAIVGVTGLTPTSMDVSSGVAPGASPTPVGSTPDQVQGLFGSAWSSLTNGLEQIGWGLVIIIALLVALLVYRPDIARTA